MIQPATEVTANKDAIAKWFLYVFDVSIINMKRPFYVQFLQETKNGD